MMDILSFDLFAFAEFVGQALDLAGVFIILVGVVISTSLLIERYIKKAPLNSLYKGYRQNVGRSILLGLEFLVAGDIIRSITGTPSFVSVGVLAIVVLIRSFLSITFEMEVDGRFPWQKKRE